MDNDKIGYLVGGHFYCLKCSEKCKNASSSERIPVYLINIKPYSQICFICDVVVVDGLKKVNGMPLQLFE